MTIALSMLAGALIALTLAWLLVPKLLAHGAKHNPSIRALVREGLRRLDDLERGTPQGGMAPPKECCTECGRELERKEQMKALVCRACDRWWSMYFPPSMLRRWR